VGFVVKDRGVSLDGPGGEQLRGNPAMLSPIDRTSFAWPRTSLRCSLPLVIIRGRGDGAATKYRLTLDEILLATGEDGAIGNQQVLGDARIRNYNKQLIAHPDREEWPISPRPGL
jgi:hypothetical protein